MLRLRGQFFPSIFPSSFIQLTLCSVPALFTFLLTPENTLKYMQTVRLPGNALAVAVSISTTDSGLVVSVDSIHKPISTTERRVETEDAVEPLHLYKFHGRELVAGAVFSVAARDEEPNSARLTNLLYNLEKLRKRDGEAKELE